MDAALGSEAGCLPACLPVSPPRLWHLLLQALVAAFPGTSPLLDNVRANYDMWADAEKAAGEPA